MRLNLFAVGIELSTGGFGRVCSYTRRRLSHRRSVQPLCFPVSDVFPFHPTILNQAHLAESPLQLRHLAQE